MNPIACFSSWLCNAPTGKKTKKFLFLWWKIFVEELIHLKHVHLMNETGLVVTVLFS